MTSGVGGAVLVALVAIVPLVVLMLTSFVKISVVLSLLRNALGAPDAPSGLVVMGLSLILTFFVMAPVAIDIAHAVAQDTPRAPGPSSPVRNAPVPGGVASGAAAAGAAASSRAGASAQPQAEAALGSSEPRGATSAPVDAGSSPAGSLSPAGAGSSPAGSPHAPRAEPASARSSPRGAASTSPEGAVAATPGAAGQPIDLEAAVRALVPAQYQPQVDAVSRAMGPPRGFLARHASVRDRETFTALAGRMGRAVTGDEIWVLAPAFVSTELREAFAIAVLLFVPFLVLDLVVGLGLAALGLSASSPQAIALPLKLLLFVSVDGWRLLLDALLRGYA